MHLWGALSVTGHGCRMALAWARPSTPQPEPDRSDSVRASSVPAFRMPRMAPLTFGAA